MRPTEFLPNFGKIVPLEREIQTARFSQGETEPTGESNAAAGIDGGADPAPENIPHEHVFDPDRKAMHPERAIATQEDRSATVGVAYAPSSNMDRS